MIGILSSHGGALDLSGGREYRHYYARFFASPDRCAAKRDPVRVPLGLSSPLRQYSARRNGVVAMPAEKYVEPLVGLPKRRGRRRNSIRSQDRADGSACKDRIRDGRCTQGRACRGSSPAGRRGRGHPQACHRDNEQAKQCEHCRNPQRVPKRLFEGLRRRTDRGRPCTAVSGKEQVESLSRLPEGRGCRER